MTDCLKIVQILRHEEFEEGCKASCNGWVNENTFFLSYPTCLFNIGWIWEELELISSVTWIYVNGGVGDRYRTHHWIISSVCSYLIYYIVVDHMMDFGVNRWLVLGPRTTTSWWSSPTTMAWRSTGEAMIFRSAVSKITRNCYIIEAKDFHIGSSIATIVSFTFCSVSVFTQRTY